jgi:hypothetical protein
MADGVVVPRGVVPRFGGTGVAGGERGGLVVPVGETSACDQLTGSAASVTAAGCARRHISVVAQPITVASVVIARGTGR